MAFNRPNPGDKPDLILSAQFQGVLVDLANAYLRGDLTKEPKRETPFNALSIENNTGEDLDEGQLLALNDSVNFSPHSGGRVQKPTRS